MLRIKAGGVGKLAYDEIRWDSTKGELAFVFEGQIVLVMEFPPESPGFIVVDMDGWLTFTDGAFVGSKP